MPRLSSSRAIAFCLFVLAAFIAPSMAEATLEAFVNGNTVERTFRDDHDEDITLWFYDIQDNHFDSRVFGSVFNPGLKQRSKRVELYEQLITVMVTQELLFATDELVKASEGGVPKEELLAYATGIVGFPVDLLEFIAHNANLRYIKGVDDWVQRVNHYKHLLRHARHSQALSNAANALTVLGIALDAKEIKDQGDQIAANLLVAKALQADYVMNRLMLLSQNCTLEDPAFRTALENIISQSRAMSESDWQELLYALKANKEELLEIVIAGANITHGLHSIFAAHGPHPASGWIFAVLFTRDTINMILAHEEDLRLSSLAASLFHHLEEGHEIETQLWEFSGFFFSDRIYHSMDNWGITVVGLFNDFDEVRQSWLEERNSALESIQHRRILRALQLASTQGSISQSILILLDTSDSMNEDLKSGGGSKIAAAKTAAIALVNGTGGSPEFALVTFSGCRGQVALPFTQDRQTIRNAVDNLSTSGKTPLADGLEVAIDYFLRESISPYGNIVLLSDGEETCGGNPISVARRIAGMNPENLNSIDP